MNKKRITLIFFFFFLTKISFFFFANTLFSQNITIRLEIFCDGPLQPIAAQEWGRALNDLRFQSVQVRAGNSTDVLDIQPLGNQMYRVSGMLTRDNRVLMPGNTIFTLGQIRSIKPYLEEQITSFEMELAQEAKNAENTDGASRQEELIQDISEPVGFTTLGLSRRKVLQKMARTFHSRLQFPQDIQKAFEDDDLVTEELRDVARGTALVYVLRYLGYCVVPQMAEADSGWILQIIPSDKVSARDILPVGYQAENVVQDVLFERFQANIDGATAETVLNSLQKRLNIPFLYDYNSMAGRGIELADIQIRQKSGRFTYKQLLDAVLYQAQLQREVRVDEAGQIFFWITTIRPAD